MELSLSQTQRNIIIASLLHDVGKYYNFKKGSNHPENSALLIDKILKNVEARKVEERLGIDFLKIKNLVKNHHSYVEDLPLRILQKADRSTSLEREESEKTEKERISTPLSCIFSIIKPLHTFYGIGGKSRYFVGKRISELIKLIEKNDSTTISSLILKDSEEETDIKSYYSERNWQEMENLLVSVFKNPKDIEVLISNLDVTLFDFLKLIPSDVHEEEAFIPLYDHLKLTAAISLILSKSVQEFKSMQQESFPSEITAISVDIGNIQNFISKSYNYEEARKGATKRIRGRSCFISLITEIIADYIVEKLGLTSLNIIRASAGNIFIISHKLKEEEKKKLKEDIEDFVLKEFKGDLLVSIVFLDYDIASLFVVGDTSLENEKKKFEDLLMEISIRIEKEKAKRFSSVLSEIAEMNKKKAGTEICKICGNSLENDNEYCKLCEFLKDFGGDIVKNNFIVVIKNASRELLNKIKKEYTIKIGKNSRNSQVSYTILAVDRNEVGSLIREGGDFYLFFFLNQLSDVLENRELIQKVKLKPLMEYSYVPIDEEGRILPIECEEGEKSSDEKRKDLLNRVEVQTKGKKSIVNFNKLCVAYFDLDNAGKIFGGSKDKTYKVIYPQMLNDSNLQIISFKVSDMSPSRWTTLSFFTHFFFGVIANKLAEKWNVYVVFSGGDDIKIFGSPYEVLNFYFDFVKEFVCYFEGKLSFSGGILLADKTTPIFNSIRMVEELESIGKRFCIGTNEVKGSVAFINRNYVFPIYSSWYMEKMFNELLNVVKINEEGMISTSSLFNIYRIASSHIKNIDITDGRTAFVGFSRIEYILKRNWVEKNGKKWEDFMEEYITKNAISISNSNFLGINFFVPIFSFFYLVISGLTGGGAIEGK